MPPKPVAAVALLLFLAAGCGGTTAHDIPVDSLSSPLGTGGTTGDQCAPDPTGVILTYGTIVLENRSKHPVTVERVSFSGDHHLQLAHAAVVPIRGSLIGIEYGWPPSRKILSETGVPWSQRLPASGATIPPGTSLASRRELLIGMLPTAPRSVADAVVVRYRAGRKHYELRTHTKTVISKSASNC